MSNPDQESHYTTIGSLSFTYEGSTKVDITPPLHWFVVYRDATLETGENVAQISVEYNLEPSSESEHRPIISVYLETEEGGIHAASRDTIEQLAAQ